MSLSDRDSVRALAALLLRVGDLLGVEREPIETHGDRLLSAAQEARSAQLFAGFVVSAAVHGAFEELDDDELREAMHEYGIGLKVGADGCELTDAGRAAFEAFNRTPLSDEIEVRH